jgi:hypothetical protein
MQQLGTHTLDPSALRDPAAFKRALTGHGFLGPEARQAIGPEIGPAHLRHDLPLYLRRIAEPKPLHTLVKLFVLDQWQTEDDAAAALHPVGVDECARAGLVERGPRGLRARVRFDVHKERLLAHDRYEPGRADLRADHVLGTNGPALTLDSLSVRRRVGSTLDLGVGGGVQSLLCAEHSERVVGTDMNPRALEFARFNAAVNDVSNLELRQGDLFEPVRGERFDLVVCNPPYVISPEARLAFRDSGRPADGICEEVVRRAPEHLEEGGYATVLLNWAVRAGEEWSAPLRRWVAGSGCDAWLLHSDTQDPLSYAAVWNRGRDAADYEASLDSWVDYDRAAGVAGIGMGAVILRRRNGGQNWVRADELQSDPKQPCGDHIQRVFMNQDRLEELVDDAALLEERFELSEDHRVRQTLRVRAGRFEIETADLELASGLAFKGAADAYLLQLLLLCDGRPLGDVVTEMARRGAANQVKLSAVVAEAVRRLASLGFVRPCGARRAPERRSRTVQTVEVTHGRGLGARA